MIEIKDLKCEYMTNPLGIDVLTPRFSWVLSSNERGQKQSAWRVIVKKGDEIVFNSKKQKGGQSCQVEYAGAPLESFTQYTWFVTIWDKYQKEVVSEPATFETAMLHLYETNLSWAGLSPDQNPVSELSYDKLGRPAPLLRRTFTLEKPVKSARCYVTALGIYELFVNGQKAGGARFAPGWTDYNKQIQYQTYDITQSLRQGENVISAMLGDGWYAGSVACVGRNQYGDYPLLLKALFRLTYEDGEVETIGTGPEWKVSTGPILYNDLLNGEVYDANLEPQGWKEPGFDDSAWLGAFCPNKTMGRLRAQMGPQVTENLVLAPRSVEKIADDTFIFDMGQNMVGNVEIRLSAAKGTKITLRYGEMLNGDGTLYTENLRSAMATDTYIAKGAGCEVYEPVFTFHGFRYVEVKGVSAISKDDLCGKVLYSQTAEAGSFSCSSELVNKLFSNIKWGQRGNFVSIPTDCPQRDERMGWTGDAQVFVKTGCFNMDTPAFYTKYMQDMADAMHPTGCFTDVAPYVMFAKDKNGLVGHGNTAWGDAGIIIPWTLYEMYADRRILETYYSDMALHLDYMVSCSKNFIRYGWGYGDWLSVGEVTDTPAMNTAFLAYDAHLMEKIAGVLGKKEDEKKFARLFDNIKAAFNKEFVEKDGRIINYTQTIYVMALKFNLLTAQNRKKAAKYLAENIGEKGGHLATGFVGVGYLLPMLSEEGYNDLAYQLITNTTYPSWGYSIVNGATTIWERWNSYTKEQGFGDVGMNSFNHYSLGSCGEWLYRYAAGIREDDDAPGFSHIIIKPYINKAFGFVKCRYMSIRGEIVSNWSLDGGLTLEVSIPANTTATIWVPAGKDAEILENGVTIAKAEGLKLKGYRDGYAVLEAVSGAYRFSVAQ